MDVNEWQKRNSILGFLKTYNADIVCLQEMHDDSEKDEDRWTKEWGGEGHVCGVGEQIEAGE